MKKRLPVGLLLVLLPGATPEPPQPLLNEFVVNHTGIDTHEFIEIYGAPDTDYSAYTVLEIEGDQGTTLGVIDGAFPVETTDHHGFWTTGFLNSAIENGTVTLLLVKRFTGAVGTDLDADDDGVLDPAPPWKRLHDTVAVTDDGPGDQVYSDAVLRAGFDGHTATPGGASRLPDGADTDTASDWLRNDFDGDGLPRFPDAPPAATGEAVNTPDAKNRAGFTPPPPPPPPGLLINEIDADTPGTDTREFIELYDGGHGHTSLDDLVLVLFNGSTDRSYRTIDLDGFATDAEGFFVIGGPEVIPRPGLLLPPSALQNGADAVALYAGDPKAFPNRTPVTTAFLVDAVVYDTHDDDDTGLLVLLLPGQPQVNESAWRNRNDVSIQRLPNGAGRSRETVRFAPFPPTPGSVNGGADLSLRQYVETLTYEGTTRQVTFLLQLTNAGPARASAIEITDHLPDGTTFVSARAGQGVFDPTTAVWQVGDLVPGDAALLHLTVLTEAGASLNRAEVTAVQQPDPDSIPGDGKGDDFAVVVLDRPPPNLDRFRADLRLTMTATPTTPYPGDTLLLTLTITNDGPSPTAGVAVVDRLPDGLSYVAATGDGRYAPATGLWTLGRLGRTYTKTLALTATVTGTGSLVNTAEVIRSTLPDPDSHTDNDDPYEDDRASVTVNVQTTPGKATGSPLLPTPMPLRLIWGPSYPNPFHAQTTIPLLLPEATHVTITIYDVRGRIQATLVDQWMPSGIHLIPWNASLYPSGTYLAQLKAKDQLMTHSLIVLH